MKFILTVTAGGWSETVLMDDGRRLEKKHRLATGKVPAAAGVWIGDHINAASARHVLAYLGRSLHEMAVALRDRQKQAPAVKKMVYTITADGWSEAVLFHGGGKLIRAVGHGDFGLNMDTYCHVRSLLGPALDHMAIDCRRRISSESRPAVKEYLHE